MIQIRRAGIADLSGLIELFDLYRIFYHQPSDIAAAKRFLEERINGNESVIFIAELQNRMIGFTQLYPIFSSVSMQRAWLLNDLYVHASARKQGVAALLLQAAKQHGLNTHSKYLLLETQNENFTAQSVYEKNGWTKTADFFYELSLK